MFASTLGTVIGFVLVIFLSVIVMAGIVSSVMMSSKNLGENVSVKDNSILVIDMEDELVERKKLSPFEGIEIE